MRPDPLPSEAAVWARVEQPETCPETCTVEMVPGGPALVRGAAAVRDSAGALHPTSRPVVGVCTCGLTQREPWCDATHKMRVERATGGDGPGTLE